MRFRVEIIDNPDDFNTIRAAWARLLESSPDNSLTLTWEWLSTWWRVFAHGRRLRIIAVSDGAELIGAAPLLAQEEHFVHHGLIPFRRFELLASGEGAGEAICSDYIGWVAAAGRELEVVRAILDCLQGDLDAQWEEILLPDVWDGSPTLNALQNELPQRRLYQEIRSRSPSPYIRLPSSFDEFLGGLSSSLRYQVRRGRREFEKIGGVYRVVGSADELGPAFETLVSLHQARWTAKGASGAFASENRRSFHEAILPLALARGWLRLGILETAKGPIGAIYNFRYAGRVYFYQSGIQPQENTNLRPGVLLHVHEIEAAIAAGAQEYDFLKRGDSDYKDHWANASRNLVCLRIAKPLLKQHLLSTARATYKAVERWRQLKRPRTETSQESA